MTSLRCEFVRLSESVLPLANDGLLHISAISLPCLLTDSKNIYSSVAFCYKPFTKVEPRSIGSTGEI